MKRKLFSAILFGALLTASTSGLTSCKDYDDDISNLQGQIDKLATADQLSAKVSEMQAAISAAQSAAEAKAAAAQTVADAAKAAAGDAAAAAKAAQSTADAAAAAAAEVQKAADKAIADLEAKAATKDELKAAADAAAAAVKAIEDAHAADKAAIEKAIADGLAEVKAEIAATNEKLAALAARLDEVDKKLAALEAGEGQEETLKEIQAEVEAVSDELKAIIGEYTTMVTDVSLYVTKGGLDNYRNGLTDNVLSFIYLDAEKDATFPAEEGVADAQIEFSSKNKNVMTKDSVVIRVSPTNALLNPENISLINSQGKELKGLVEVESVTPYNKLITKSVGSESGLWNVVFKVADGFEPEDLVDAVYTENGNIAFAVAVNNTTSVDNRRVVSAYDLTVEPEDYEPARNEFQATNRDNEWKNVTEIHNRYYKKAADNYIAKSENGQEAAGTEYRWINAPQVAPSKETIMLDVADARFGKKVIDVEVGKEILLSVGTELKNGQPSLGNLEGDHSVTTNAQTYAIKGFYVTLDKDFAIESNPSEWNAWKKYDYTNVGIQSGDKYQKAAKLFYGNVGSISIDSEDAVNDIIGFRVYAVNLDGTLIDPDGKAFYVHVATEKEVAPLTASELVAKLQPSSTSETNPYAFKATAVDAAGKVTATNYYSAEVAINSGVLNSAAEGNALEWDIIDNPSAYGNNSVEPEYDTDYKIVFSVKSNKIVAKVMILDPLKFIDDETYTAVATLTNDNGTEVRDITVEFQKAIPTEAPALAWNASFDPTKQVFSGATMTGADIYKVVPNTAWAGLATPKTDKPQSIELNYLMSDLTYGSWTSTNSYYYVWVTKKDPKKTYELPTQGATAVWPAAVPSQYTLDVDASEIDGKPHNVAYAFDYGKISLTFDYQTAQYAEDNIVRGTNMTPLTFASWIDYEVLKWKNGSKTITYVPGATGATANVQTVTLTGTPGAAVYINATNGSETATASGNYALGSAEGKYWAKYTTDNNWYWVKKVNGAWQWIKADGTASQTMNNDPRNYGLQWLGATAPTAVTTGGTAGEIVAYNTVIPNTQGGVAVFGTQAEPVNFKSLLDKYVNARVGTFNTTTNLFDYNLPLVVSFSNAAFKATVDAAGEISLTQQPTTTNPVGQTGILSITGKDSFGHSKTWTLEIKIQ